MRGWWKDTGHLEDMLEANRLVLEDLERRIEGELVDSRVEGRVVIEPGARLERSLVRGPAVIGAGSRIADSYVGPYTSIAGDVEITSSEVEHSILLAGSRVSDLGARMEASLLGRNAVLKRGDGLPKTLRLHRRRQLGDRDPVTRVLITGAGGMLGRDVIAACSEIDAEAVPLAHADLDITDGPEVDAAMAEHRPAAVVNCAAWTDVDGAEEHEPRRPG